MKKILFILLLGSLSAANLSASHNMGVDFLVVKTGPSTASITLTTYTDPFAAGTDLCSASIEIWNSTGTTLLATLSGIPRSNGGATDPFGVAPPCGGNIKMGEVAASNVKKNVYVVSYSVSPGTTIIARYSGPHRAPGVTNLTSSETLPMTAECKYTQVSSGNNSTPVFQNVPDFTGCVNTNWQYATGLVDPDGDVIVLEEAAAPRCAGTCTGYVREDVAGGGNFYVSGTTVTWNNCANIGLYAHALRVKEYRAGVLISESHVERQFWMVTSGCRIQQNTTAPEPLITFAQDFHNQTVTVRSAEMLNCVVYDAAGNVVMEFRTSGTDDPISLQSLSSGVYLLAASGSTARETFRFIHY